jgi:hypothetical protein
MGFRFRKSIKLFPGFRINLSKKGVSSVSIGQRGATLNVGEHGTRATVGIPGTGISYSEQVSDSSDGVEQAPESSSTPEIHPAEPSSKGIERLKTCLIIALLLVIVVILLK